MRKLLITNAVKRASFDKRFEYNNGLKRFAVHPHVLRKFFRTKMGSVIPVDVVEALMGHEGYLISGLTGK